MFNSPDELLHKIRLGEDTSLELKAVRFRGDRVSGPRRDELADELAAIANTHDGVIVLGVDDKTRDIIGIPLDHLDVVDRFVYEICNESITPPVHFRSFRMQLPDATGNLRSVLNVEIPRSLFVHRSPGGYFFRQGSSKREMPPDYLTRRSMQLSQARLIRFEEQPVPNSGLDDLSEKLRTNYTKRSDESDEAVLLKRGLLSKEESGEVRASVSGILFCCRNSEHFLPNAYIEAVRYRGKKQDSNYQIDARKIHGPLNQQIDQAMTFLRKNQTVSAIKIPHRVEMQQSAKERFLKQLSMLWLIAIIPFLHLKYGSLCLTIDWKSTRQALCRIP